MIRKKSIEKHQKSFIHPERWNQTEPILSRHLKKIFFNGFDYILCGSTTLYKLVSEQNL